MVVPGMIISLEKLNLMWNAGENHHKSKRFRGVKIIPYPETWLESLKRLWISR
jgi:hypothetical protein